MKANTNDKVVALTNQIEEGIKALFNSEKFKDYLKIISKFYNYSTNNIILIAMQRPDATYVAGYKSWAYNFDRHVKEGAKGIKILQPAPFKIKTEEPLLDSQGIPVLNEDGSRRMQIKEKMIPSYKVGFVFAYEDTEGKPLPSLVSTLTDPVKDYALLKEMLERISPASITYEPMDGSSNGYYSLADRSIHIKDTLPELQTIKTMVHEIAHAILHDAENGIHTEANRNEKEVEAEAVAYTVLNYYGFDTSEYSFGYIAGWSRTKELAELKHCMDQIRMASGVIICKMDEALTQERLLCETEVAYRFRDQSFLYIKKEDTGYAYSCMDRWGGLSKSGQLITGKPLGEVVDEIMSSCERCRDDAMLCDTQAAKERIEAAKDKPNVYDAQAKPVRRMR